jgi:hypothetical integral membrane protein (TIGR02206 family)
VPGYGLSHILWLIGIAGAATGLGLLCRGKRLPHPVVRAVLACGLAATEIERTVHDGWRFPDRMPLNLCNVSTWMAVVALVTLWPLAVEFAYFVGLSGAAAALLSPEMGAAWPFRFFLNQGGAVITATVLVFGLVGQIRHGAVWRVFGLLVIYMILLGTFDWVFATNYGFLRHRPEGVTVASLMGRWPFYIAWCLLGELGVFWLLWIPARRLAA